MITMRVKDIKMRSKEVMKRVERGTIDSAVKCAVIVADEMKRLLSVGGGSRHAPSAPGQPPHVQTGALRASVRFAKTKRGAIAGTLEWYGRIHEFGGRNHPKRRFALPALRNTQHRFPAQYRGSVR